MGKEPTRIATMRMSEFAKPNKYRTPGSVERTCIGCGEAVSVAPSSLKMMEEHPDHDYEFWCMDCAVSKDTGDDVPNNIIPHRAPGSTGTAELQAGGVPALWFSKIKEMNPDDQYLEPSGEWVTARLVKLATSDGLVRMKDHIEVGKEYRIDPHSRQVQSLFNMEWREFHEKDMVLVDHPTEKQWLPVELLEFDGKDR